MRATRQRNSTTEHGHAVSIREYQSDPWSEKRPSGSAPRSPPHATHRNHQKKEPLALTKVAPYQEPDPRLSRQVARRVPRSCLVASCSVLSCVVPKIGVYGSTLQQDRGRCKAPYRNELALES